MNSPWGMLAEMPDVELIWTSDDELLDGADSWWDPDDRIIYMDSRLKRMVARCALAHELAHVVREDSCTDHEFFDNRAEIAADRLAARWLLPSLDAIAYELATAVSRGHVAFNLHVTQDILDARLDGLHPSERHALNRQIATYSEVVHP